MKKFVLYGLWVGIACVMQSCLFSEDDLFDMSSAERENASIVEAKELLKGAANGWKMEYHYGPDGNWGVSTIFAQFKDTEVLMASDFTSDSYTAGEVATSLYKVQAYQGTELSFDSYNQVIHLFCEPNSESDPGLYGDYEFVIRTMSAERIELTGKKHGVQMVMTPITEGMSWGAHLQLLNNMDNDTDFASFKVIVNGSERQELDREYRTMVASKELENGDTEVTYHPFICTQDGIRFVESLEYDNVQAQNFKWDDETHIFSCTDEGVDAQLTYTLPEGYAELVGTYQLAAADFYGRPFTTYLMINPLKESRSYSATYYLGNGGAFSLTFNFNRNTKSLDFPAQAVGSTSSGIPIYMYVGSAAGNFYPYMDYGFYGTTVEDENGLHIVLRAGSGLAEAGMNACLFLYNSGGWYLADCWSDPVLHKLD